MRSLTSRLKALEKEEEPKISFVQVETHADADALHAYEERHNIVPPPGRIVLITGVPESIHLTGESHD